MSLITAEPSCSNSAVAVNGILVVIIKKQGQQTHATFCCKYLAVPVLYNIKHNARITDGTIRYTGLI